MSALLRTLILPLLVLLATTQAVFAKYNFRAAEWGTFTSLQGSNGIAMPGMHHEEEQLPSFVHGRDPLTETPAPQPPYRCRFKCMEFDPVPEDRAGRLKVTQKMETPVVYFYSDEPRKVEVTVDFPQGIISQYYPRPTEFAPAIGQARSLSGGRTKFQVDLLTGQAPLPVVPGGNVYGPARNVPEANTVSSNGEHEKFIFYRGLGDFATKLSATSKDGELTLTNRGAKIPVAFLLNVNEKGGAIQELGSIDAAKRVSKAEIESLRANPLPEEAFFTAARKALVLGLHRQGLTVSEARAMFDTWKHSYLRTPGLRVLYVLSREETDALLPLKITPQPDVIDRALVGRIEILLDTDEKALLARIEKEASALNPATLGRFAEPVLRRVREIAPSSALQSTIDTILQRLP